MIAACGPEEAAIDYADHGGEFTLFITGKSNYLSTTIHYNVVQKTRYSLYIKVVAVGMVVLLIMEIFATYYSDLIVFTVLDWFFNAK